MPITDINRTRFRLSMRLGNEMHRLKRKCESEPVSDFEKRSKPLVERYMRLLRKLDRLADKQKAKGSGAKMQFQTQPV